MADSTNTRSPREQQLDALIAKYYEAVEQGQPVDQADFLRQHAEFATELRDFFADIGQLEKVAPPLNPELEETQPLTNTTTGLKQGTVVRYFGGYEILEELGTGGMGVVYKARQVKLKKIVALKMIKVGQFASNEELRRFQAEARAAAKLNHPGIVAVHEVGINHGQHYYVMDFVGGGSLSKLHRDEPVAARRAAELVKQLADAMHYAHGQGIIHRDLKPANVLLTTDGGARITDFGLAKSLWSNDESDGMALTETGQVLGTAGYMSPEQAAGKTRLVGPPADIYSLGAVLYALLTTRAPFVGESLVDTIQQVIHREPVSPRVLNPSIALDLETICLKCLEKEPHKRYGTAELLSADLCRFLDGRPVLARPIRRIARVWRWCRRNPLVSSLAATSALFLLTVIVLLTAGYFVQSRFASALQVEIKRANQNLYFIGVQAANQAVSDGRFKSAGRWLDQTPPECRHWEYHWLMRRCNGGYGQPLELSKRSVMPFCRAYSPNGQLLAVGALDDESFKDPQFIPELQLLNAKSGQVVSKYRGFYLAFAPDSRSVAVASRADAIELIDITSGERKRTFQLKPAVPGLLIEHLKEGVGVIAPGFSPDGRFLAAYEFGSRITLWNVDSEEAVLSIALPSVAELQLGIFGDLGWMCGSFQTEQVFSPDGKMFAFPAATTPSAISLWDLDKSRVVQELMGHTVPVMGLQFNAGGTRLASVDKEMNVIIWNPSTGEKVFEVAASSYSFRFSPNGKWLSILSGGPRGGGRSGDEGRVKVFDVADGRLRWELNLSGMVVDFSHDGSLLFVATRDFLHVIHASTGQDLFKISSMAGRLATAPRANAVVSDDWGSIRILDLSGLVFGEPDPDWETRWCTFSSNGKLFWRFGHGAAGWSLQAWDFKNERKLLDPQFTDYLLSPDGCELAAARENATEIWDLRSFEANRDKIIRPRHTISATGKPLAFDSRRRRLIVEKVTETRTVSPTPDTPDSSYEVPATKEVSVWSFDRSATVLKLVLRSNMSPAGKPLFVIRTPDNQELAANSWEVSCSDDAGYLAALCGHDLHLWDCEIGQRTQILNHASPVIQAKFAPHGAHLATGAQTAARESTVCLWDPASGKLLHQFAHQGTIEQLEFSATGERLLCRSNEQLQLWSISGGQLLLSSSGTGENAGFSPDGKLIFHGRSPSDECCLHRIADGKIIVLSGLYSYGNYSFSPDSQRLLIDSRIFDTETGTEVFRGDIPRGRAIFSPDGSQILVDNLRFDSQMRRTPEK